MKNFLKHQFTSNILRTEKAPLKMWLPELEEGALEQAKNLANLPHVFKHISIMPDSHQGYGMPIGSIMASKQLIIPNGVGVDIGCGMIAQKTSLQDLTKNDLHAIMKIARKLIPVGFNYHEKPQDEKHMPQIPYQHLKIVSQNYDRALQQIGTLGGGNHFVELQKGDDGFVWMMIHSGSRNLGHSVATYYDKLAKKMHKQNNTVQSHNIVKNELSYFYLDSEEGRDYIDEMNYCIEFALSNRILMLKRLQKSISAVMGEFETDEFINKSHNFAAWEEHFGERVMVHRKGAMRANDQEIGMIPGSQGTKSFIVKGKGNADSFCSCSHGAGRKLSRKRAKKELNLKDEIEILDRQGIVHGIRNTKDLDEAPSAYKNIDEVMNNQRDLADVMVELTPIAVLKG